MKNKKYGIKKRRTNIMPEHLRKREFISEELHDPFGRYIESIRQSDFNPFEWHVFVIEPFTRSMYTINTKGAHEMYEQGHPCFAYVDDIHVQVNEGYFTR